MCWVLCCRLDPDSWNLSAPQSPLLFSLLFLTLDSSIFGSWLGLTSPLAFVGTYCVWTSADTLNFSVFCKLGNFVFHILLYWCLGLFGVCFLAISAFFYLTFYTIKLKRQNSYFQHLEWGWKGTTSALLGSIAKACRHFRTSWFSALFNGPYTQLPANM